tara:strand:- start:1094 stop:1219 length:126 start_codon:yes stop_codon:yes gene_type:complete
MNGQTFGPSFNENSPEKDQEMQDMSIKYESTNPLTDKKDKD